MIVQITRFEWRHAELLGVQRQEEAVKRRQRNAHGLDGSNPDRDLLLHILGAAGEFAVAKLLDLYPGFTVNVGKAPDVSNLYVRTRSRPDYEMIIRANDPEGVYVLARTTTPFTVLPTVPPDFEVPGAILASAARRPERRKFHGGRAPAWFVPDQSLAPLCYWGFWKP